MESTIFIGGWENTGTRLISLLLSEFGYENFYGKNTNKFYDFMGGRFLKLFDKYYHKKKSIKIFTDIFDKNIKNHNKCIFKHGHICFMFPELKEQYKNCKTILCIRNPLDSLVKPSHNYKRYGLYDSWNPTLEKKFDHYKKWYSTNIINSTDIIIKMEDLVYNPINTIKNILDKLNIPIDENKIKNFCKILKPSKTIGQGEKKLLNQDNKLNQKIINFKKQFNY